MEDGEGAGATAGAPYQPKGAGSEALPLELQDNFHPGSRWRHVRSMGVQGVVFSGTNLGVGGGSGSTFGTGRVLEPWQRWGESCTTQGGAVWRLCINRHERVIELHPHGQVWKGRQGKVKEERR